MRPQDRYSFNFSVLLSVCPVFLAIYWKSNFIWRCRLKQVIYCKLKWRLILERGWKVKWRNDKYSICKIVWKYYLDDPFYQNTCRMILCKHYYLLFIIRFVTDCPQKYLGLLKFIEEELATCWLLTLVFPWPEMSHFHWF